MKMNKLVYGRENLEANQTMESSKQKSFFLRSTTAVSLNERFSQVQMDQVTKTRAVTLDPVVLQQEAGDDAVQVVLVLKRKPPKPVPLKTQTRRRSVWTRLSLEALAQRRSRPQGASGISTDGEPGGGNLHHRFMKRRLLKKRNLQEPKEGGGASTLRGPKWKREVVPTKQELDAELDKYMSMSKRRLDEQLDEYMASAGQANLSWDWGGQDQTDPTWD